MSTFAITQSDLATGGVVDSINYILANLGDTLNVSANLLVADTNSGRITNSTSGQVVAYLYQYLNVRYATSSDGSTGFSQSPTNATYFGVRNQTTNAADENPVDYYWTLVTGGFGTTKFLWYATLGGRQVTFYIGNSAFAPNFVQTVNGVAIDLDQTTGLSTIATDVNAYFMANSTPATPTGGFYDYNTLTLTPPNPVGWTAGIPSITANNVIYVSQTVFLGNIISNVAPAKPWTTPVQYIGAFNGNTGAPGSRGFIPLAFIVTATDPTGYSDAQFTTAFSASRSAVTPPIGVGYAPITGDTAQFFYANLFNRANDITTVRSFNANTGPQWTNVDSEVISGNLIYPGSIIANKLSVNDLYTITVQSTNSENGNINANGYWLQANTGSAHFGGCVTIGNYLTVGSDTQIGGNLNVTGIITGGTLNANTVGTIQLVDNAITTGKITLAAITNQLIAANAITGNLIAYNTVGTNNIVLGAITNALIGASAVNGATQIVNNSISNNQIVQNGLQAAFVLANSSITGNLITTNTITGTLIAPNTLTGNLIAASTITGNLIALNTVTGNLVAQNTLTGNLIAQNTVTGNLIAQSTITGNLMALSTITGNLMAQNTITGNLIASNTITGNLIAGSTITGNLIAQNTITGSLIALNTLTGNLVVTGTLTGDKIAAATITADKMAAGVLTVGDINSIGSVVGDYAAPGYWLQTSTGSARFGGTINIGSGLSVGSIITGSALNSGVVDTAQLVSNAVTNAKLATAAVGTNNIQNQSITTALIGLGNITTALIGSGAVNGSTQIATGSITTTQILPNGLVAGTVLTNNTITGNLIAVNTITGNLVALNTLTGNLIAANTITGNLIAGNTITGNLLASGTITADKIAVGVLTVGNINSIGSTVGDYAATGYWLRADTGSGYFGGNLWVGNNLNVGNLITASNLNANSITTNSLVINSTVHSVTAVGDPQVQPIPFVTNSALWPIPNRGFAVPAGQPTIVPATTGNVSGPYMVLTFGTSVSSASPGNTFVEVWKSGASSIYLHNYDCIRSVAAMSTGANVVYAIASTGAVVYSLDSGATFLSNVSVVSPVTTMLTTLPFVNPQAPATAHFSADIFGMNGADTALTGGNPWTTLNSTSSLTPKFNMYGSCFAPSTGVPGTTPPGIVVGSAGQIIRVTNAATVTGSDTNSTVNDLFDVASDTSFNRTGVSNYQCVAVGAGGMILYTQKTIASSTVNSSTWTQKNAGLTTNNLNSVWCNYTTTAVGTRWVAVGDNGTIITSTDGLTWTVVSSPTAVNLHGVIFGGSNWVAVGDSGTILTSTNGTTWTSVSSPTTRHLYSATYSPAGTIFNIAGQEQILASGAGNTTFTSVYDGGVSFTSSYTRLLGYGSTSNLYNISTPAITSQIGNTTISGTYTDYAFTANTATTYYLVVGNFANVTVYAGQCSLTATEYKR